MCHDVRSNGPRRCELKTEGVADKWTGLAYGIADARRSQSHHAVYRHTCVVYSV